MTYVGFGFISEMEKLSGVEKLVFKEALEHGMDLPWKALSGWQKARVAGGIAANTAFGVLPVGAAGVYGVNKIRGKDSYKDKYERLSSEHNALKGAIAQVQSEK